MLRRLASLVVGAFVSAAAWPSGVAAHGAVPAQPPTLTSLLLGWHLDPLIVNSVRVPSGPVSMPSVSGFTVGCKL